MISKLGRLLSEPRVRDVNLTIYLRVNHGKFTVNEIGPDHLYSQLYRVKCSGHPQATGISLPVGLREELHCVRQFLPLRVQPRGIL